MTTTDTTTGLTFTDHFPLSRPAPTTAEVGAALARHAGQWAVVYVADRLARAEAYTNAVNSGAKFGPGHTAVIVKIGAEHRVYASRSAS